MSYPPSRLEDTRPKPEGIRTPDLIRARAGHVAAAPIATIDSPRARMMTSPWRSTKCPAWTWKPTTPRMSGTPFTFRSPPSLFRPQPPDAERLGVEEHHVPTVAAAD